VDGLTEFHLRDNATGAAICGVPVELQLGHSFAIHVEEITCAECFRVAYLRIMATVDNHAAGQGSYIRRVA
jgi:hypothetical protein